MSLYNDYYMNNSFLGYSDDPPMNFTNLGDNEEIFSYDYNKACDNNINRNNALFGLPTRATLNEKGDEQK